MKRMITVQYTGVLRVETERTEEQDAVADAVFAVTQNVRGVTRVEGVTVETVTQEGEQEETVREVLPVVEPGAE